MGELLQYIFSGLIGCVYALVAIGYTVVYNATNSYNFLTGEYAMLGGVIALTLASYIPLPLIVIFLLSVVSVTLISILCERLTIRPVKNMAIVTFVLITWGFSLVTKGVVLVTFGPYPKRFPSFTSEEPIRILGAAITPQILWVLGISMLLFILIYLFFSNTLQGKAMIATRDNKTGALLVGIDTSKVVLLSFILSGATGAAGGILIAPWIFVSHDSGGMIGLKGFCACVIGGLGSVPGAVVGGFLLGMFESLAAGLISSGYKDALAFIGLIIILCFRPSGIMGKRVRRA